MKRKIYGGIITTPHVIRGENAMTILKEMEKLFWQYTERNDKLMTKLYQYINKGK